MGANDGQVLKRLQEWADQEGELPGFVALYRSLLQAQLRVKSRVSIESSPAPEVVAERLGRGSPSPRFDEIAWDWALFNDLFREVLGTLAEHQVADPKEAEALGKAADDPSFLPEASRSLYEGQGRVEEAHSGLLQMALQTTCWPFLSRYSEALTPLIPQKAWLRRTCPICGGGPDFGFLEREAGARWLMCSRCDARWLFKRLECPHCGTEDQDKLSYLTSEDGLYRLYLCEQCRGYLKVVDLRKTESEVLLPLERILTLDMDRQAHDLGYRLERGTMGAGTPPGRGSPDQSSQ